MLTGIVSYTRLLKVNKYTQSPVLDENGKVITKPNQISDSDYIKPFYSEELCPVKETNITTYTSTSTSTSTTTQQPPTDPCTVFVRTYGTACDNPYFNVVTIYMNKPTEFITVEVHKNNNIVGVFDNIPVIGGQASFKLDKSIIEFTTLIINDDECRVEFVANIGCGTIVTSTTTTTSTTSTTTTSTSTTTSSTTSSTSTTTIVVCNATFAISNQSGCALNNTFTIQIYNSNSTSPVNVTYGFSSSNNVNSVSNWQVSNTLTIPGDGVNYYIFVRYGNTGQCVNFAGVVNQTCGIAVTSTTTTTTTTTTTSTTSSTTTTTIGCNLSVTIDNVYTVSSNVIRATAFITGTPQAFLYKLKLAGTIVASGFVTTLVAPNVYQITFDSYVMTNGATYQLFMHSPNCPEGTGFSFVYNSAGCTDINEGWNYRYTATSGGAPFASLAAAQASACGTGFGCAGYLVSATMGSTFYTRRMPATNCAVGACDVLPTGYYWIYRDSDINDVYVIHVTNGIIDELVANPCGV